MSIYSTCRQILLIFFILGFAASTEAQTPVAGRNVNMVGGIGRTRNLDGTYSFALGDGDPFLTKQNEPSMAVSSLNPLHLMAASNDYRLIPLAQSVTVPGQGQAADSWIGLYRSTDGGRNWRSTVMGGCPVAIPQCAGNTALQGTSFASDPTFRPGPYGSFFLSFIAGSRGTSASGVVGIQRYFDLNNNVSADDNPFRADALNVVDTGTTGQFLDKTWNIADVPRSWNAGTTCTVPTSPTPVPAFNVYLSWSNFVGQDPTNPHPQIYVATSNNCGATFGKSVKISQSVATNQGSVLTVDPSTGTVYLIWRQIFTAANNSPDAIYFVKSTDGGKTWSAPSVISLITPFEQDTTTTSFRSEAYATAAVDDKGRVYVAWSQAGVGPTAPGATQGAARIVITTSNNGGNSWSAPKPVDNSFQSGTVPYAPGPNAPGAAPSWTAFNPYNASGYGHQFQPSLTFAAGKLTLIWLDQRLDHTYGLTDCSTVSANPAGYNISQCTEKRVEKNSSTYGDDPASAVFTDTISDGGLKFRHTVDVFGGQALPGNSPSFAVTRVSQYQFGSQGGSNVRGAQSVRQLQSNAPNLPIFAGGTTPFIGDYIDVAAQVIMPSGGSYVWNTALSNATVFHATWTDNRDVVPPADGVSWSKYQPIMTLSSDGVTVTTNPNCLPGYAGSQNQNLYTAPIFGGIEAYAVVNSKQLLSTGPRQFNIVVVNTTNQTKTVSLSASQPGGGTASFLLSALTTSVGPIKIYPSSSITRAVWVKSTNPAATVTVNVYDTSSTPTLTNLITSVVLNPDPNATKANGSAVLDQVNLDQSQATTSNISLSNTVISNIDVSNVTPAATDLSANSVSSMDLSNMDLSNMDLSNMDLSNMDLSNMDLSNMDLSNMDLSNMDLSNMDLSNMDLSNSTVQNNAPTNMDLSNAGIVDTNMLVFNNSATTDVSIDLKTLLRGGAIPPGYKVQLFGHKVYYTQTAKGCQYSSVPQKVASVNVPGPTVTQTMDLSNPGISDSWVTNGDPSNSSFSLLPGEIGHITYRLVGNPTSDQAQNQAAANEFGTNGVKSVNINQSSTTIPIPLVIATLSLADTNVNTSTTYGLQYAGGSGVVTWSLVNDTSPLCPGNISPTIGLPPGLTLISGTAPGVAGSLSGVPTVPGYYCFILQATDSTTPTAQTDRQTFTVTVHAYQTITLPAGPLVYGSTVSLPGTSNQGFSVQYTVTAGCTISGNVLKATAGTGSCTVTATNSGGPIYYGLNASQAVSLSKAPLTVAAADAAMTYGGAVPAFAATYSGLVNGDTAAALSGSPSLTTTATSSSSTGSYPITATTGTLSSGNYTFSFVNGILTINPAPITITADNAAITYGATSLPALTASYSGFVNGETTAVLTGSPSLSTTATTTSAAGTYPITAAVGTLSAANYSFAFVNGTLTIGKATLTVSANSAAMSYGGPLPAFTASYSGFANGDTAAVLSGSPSLSTTATTASAVGAYPIAAAQGTLSAANYLFAFVNGSLTVTPAPLTVTMVSTSKFYGDPLPQFVVTYSGFVLSQNSAVLGGTLLFTTAATSASAVGVYSVAPGGLTSTNYTIAFVPGALTIAKATPVFSSLASPSIVIGTTSTTIGGNLAYAAVFPSGSVSIALNGTTQPAAISGTSGAFSANFATGALPIGAYPITYTYPGDSNFLAANGSATLHVSGWSATGSMNTPRSYFGAVVLPNGKVLVAGGLDNSGKALGSAELYDPTAMTFTYTANNMPNKQNNGTVTLMGNGKVLVAGGGNASAQVYDPSTNTFSATGGMSAQRSNHTATLLNNGLVLIAGGSNNAGTTQNTAQLYDPVAAIFTPTGNMTAAREYQTATLLPNGKVLIAGGRTMSGKGYTYLNSAEIYDPATGIFTAVSSTMAAARYSHTAILVKGQVLLAGGANTAALNSAEIFDPATSTFTAAAPMITARQYATATLVGSSILEAGGLNGSTAALQTAELYQGGTFASGGSMTTARAAHIAVVLGDGSVLVAGGQNGSGVSIASAELFRTP